MSVLKSGAPHNSCAFSIYKIFLDAFLTNLPMTRNLWIIIDEIKLHNSGRVFQYFTSQRETSSISERTKIDFWTKGQEDGSNQRCFWRHIKGLSNSLSVKWASDESMWAAKRCRLCQSPAAQSPRCQTALINTPQYNWKGTQLARTAAVQWFNISVLFVSLSLSLSLLVARFSLNPCLVLFMSLIHSCSVPHTSI